MAHCEQVAAQNVERIKESRYTGRGIVIGKTPDSRHLVQVAWLSGRSKESRARRYVVRDGWVDVEPLLSGAGDDPLRHYSAMAELNSVFFVTNGRHTDGLLEGLWKENLVFKNVLDRHTYENDELSTPRIAGFVNSGRGVVEGGLAVLRKSPFSHACERDYFLRPMIRPGYGYSVYTYAGRLNPLFDQYPVYPDQAPYSGDPLLVSITSNSIEKVADAWHSILHASTRVATVVKFIDAVTGDSTVHLINEH